MATVPRSPTLPAGHPPGWYPDPWAPHQWRWWDGRVFTMHVVVAGRDQKPRLPEWLSRPVLLCAILTVPLLGYFLVTAPISVVLGLVPIVFVLPVMLWLDRVEPEPKSALIHSFLWGATVALVVSGTVNSLVFALAGETWAVVVSAPIVEEIMKGMGILWAVRRREVDGVMDGIVYAGWVALGFAVVEDITYFAQSDGAEALAVTFVARALLGPFAHPLFTAWTGLAIGRAISRGRPPIPSLWWGLALAIGSHAIWNGSIAAAAHWTDSGIWILLVAVVGFVAQFFIFAFVLYRARRIEERRLVQLIPWLAQRYGIPAAEILPFGNFRTMLSLRRSLSPEQRRHFDGVHAALARLAVLHDRPGPTDPATEAVLLTHLQQARAGNPR